jgi:lipopolysaccharide/colanic/teichoic acid biosynthesis glycosyltransferase
MTIPKSGLRPKSLSLAGENSAPASDSVEPHASRLTPYGFIAKRSFDIFLSGFGLLLSSPFWILFSIAVKLEDGGPVFYGQRRVGQYGRQFKSWKFRSMVPSADEKLQAKDQDSRITKVGRLLRATAMDELPQLWNILVGEMSFVGPRALMPEEIEVNSNGELVPMEDIPGYAFRHQVLPGLTGVAQIYAPRDIPRRNKFRYDRLYIQRQSFWLDLRLIMLSFWITFRASWEVRGDKF